MQKLSRSAAPAALAILVLAALAAMIAPGSTARKTYQLNLRGVQNVIAMRGSPTTPAGEKMVCAGEMRGSPIGEGTFKMVSLFHLNRGHATWTFYSPSGTMNGTTDTIALPAPGGALQATGQFTITGGTGAYKSATGTGTLSSLQPKGSMLTKFSVTGTESH